MSKGLFLISGVLQRTFFCNRMTQTIAGKRHREARMRVEREFIHLDRGQREYV